MCAIYRELIQEGNEPLAEEHASVLAALYLRGYAEAAALSRRKWPLVLGALRRGCAGMERAHAYLASAGFIQEACAIQSAGLLANAERLMLQEKVLTAACEGYPARWLRALGSSAPPALWRRGEMPMGTGGKFITIVGCRHVSRPVWEFARDLSAHAIALGYSVSSGGAIGCDSAAAYGAIEAERRRDLACAERASLVEVLPCGIRIRRTRRPGCALSACAPWEGFSGANAMERNHLLYSMAELAVVCQARFKDGGSWHGAVEAMRRRACKLAVRWDAKDRAARALRGLGAIAISAAGDLEAAIRAEGVQGCLGMSCET